MTTTEIRTTEPSGPGAIAGYAANCPLEHCGMELRSSLRTALELDLAVHARWHEGTDRGMLAPIPGPAGVARQAQGRCLCPSDCHCRRDDRLTICGCERHLRPERARERNLGRLTADIAAPARRSPSPSPLRDALARAERDHESRVS